MTRARPSISIVDAGIGGLTAAATRRLGKLDDMVYEQSGRFARLGATHTAWL